MTNYKEILRLHSLGINNTRIAESCGCARSTVIAALQRAREQDLSWNKIKNCSTEEVARKLYPSTALGQQYKMPDYEWVHREMQKSGVTLSLLWVEYCEQCRQSGELPYTASPRGTRSGSADRPIRFCDARNKDKIAAVRGSRKGVVMTPYLKNCAVYLCLFS